MNSGRSPRATPCIPPKTADPSAGRPGSRRPGVGAAPSGPDSSAIAPPKDSADLTFCSTISTVAPRSARPRSSVKTSCTHFGDRPIEGSSIRITAGAAAGRGRSRAASARRPTARRPASAGALRRGKKSSTSESARGRLHPDVMPPSSRFSQRQLAEQVAPLRYESDAFGQHSPLRVAVMSRPFERGSGPCAARACRTESSARSICRRRSGRSAA